MQNSFTRFKPTFEVIFTFSFKLKSNEKFDQNAREKKQKLTVTWFLVSAIIAGAKLHGFVLTLFAKHFPPGMKIESKDKIRH